MSVEIVESVIFDDIRIVHILGLDNGIMIMFLKKFFRDEF